MIPAWVLGLGGAVLLTSVLLRRALRGRGLAARGGRDAGFHAGDARALRAHLRRLGRRARGLAAGRDRARAGGADEHPDRRPPHARRGGDGARGARRRGRRRPPRAAGGGAARGGDRRASRWARGRARRGRRRARLHRRARARRGVRGGRAGFGAVAAVTAQAVESARAASGLAIGVLGGAFALRAIGDAGPHALAWFSPLGWAQAMRAFADERWWLLAPLLALAALLVAPRCGSSARRDLGAGILPPRPGPARGRSARRSRSPGGSSAARSRAGPSASRCSARRSGRSRRTSAT